MRICDAPGRHPSNDSLTESRSWDYVKDLTDVCVVKVWFLSKSCPALVSWANDVERPTGSVGFSQVTENSAGLP